MRTTVTLDPDTEHLVRTLMRERGISFKEALNDAIRRGAGRTVEAPDFSTQTASLGRSTVSIEKALQLAADLEDEELIRKQRDGR
ncbi:MAG: hypothetical protein KDB02_05435 [Acidimicrobiales bacterium]|nr:hypothetical protein [Acidimicrobiales bacterium]